MKRNPMHRQTRQLMLPAHDSKHERYSEMVDAAQSAALIIVRHTEAAVSDHTTCRARLVMGPKRRHDHETTTGGPTGGGGDGGSRVAVRLYQPSAHAGRLRNRRRLPVARPFGRGRCMSIFLFAPRAQQGEGAARLRAAPARARRGRLSIFD